MRIINLLPKPRQKEIRLESIFYALIAIMWISALSFALVLVAQFGAKLYLQNKLAAMQSNIEQLKSQVDKQENIELKNKIKIANNVIADFKDISDNSPKWSKLIEAFTKLPPQGVIINSLTVNSTSKLVTINGFSPTREAVLKLYDDIKADDGNFTNLDFPLQHIISPTNVNFQFTFNVKDQVLK